MVQCFQSLLAGLWTMSKQNVCVQWIARSDLSDAYSPHGDASGAPLLRAPPMPWDRIASEQRASPLVECRGWKSGRCACGYECSRYWNDQWQQMPRYPRPVHWMQKPFPGLRCPHWWKFEQQTRLPALKHRFPCWLFRPGLPNYWTYCRRLRLSHSPTRCRCWWRLR